MERLAALRDTLPPGRAYKPPPRRAKTTAEIEQGLRTETWMYSQQERLAAILRGAYRATHGEAPEASRAFAAAFRVGRLTQFVCDVDDAVTWWPEGTPTNVVADDVERLAMEVERIERVRLAIRRPSGYRHDYYAASDGLDEIAMRYGWVRHDHGDDNISGTGPRWGRYEGDDALDAPARIGHRRPRVVRCTADSPGAWHNPAPITINPPLHGVGVI